MTAFFNHVRTYKVQSKHYSPVVLTTLMDVGHVNHVTATAETADPLATIREEPEDDIDTAQDPLPVTPTSSPSRQTCNLGDLAQAPDSLSSAQTLNPRCLRTPLADISLDATPVSHNRDVAKLVLASRETPNSSDELAKPITHADGTASHGKFCSPRICSRFELTVSQRPGLGRTRPYSHLLRSLMDMVRLYH